ncbi:MAG: hypothetical protein AB1521_08220 [Bacteroidota bacterium]
MLLETLDLKTNDVLIYSQNLFNFNDSFKIINKKEKIKHPRRITYFDVCNYVKDPSPKNLIIYRLLTNVNNLDAYSTKYGYFIKISGRIELIYFDPIFAIKDLRHLRFDLDPNHFRFKIQQVGLTSLTRWESEPDFAEVFHFDLKAIEAQNQNDKIYADAIFAFDPDFSEKEHDEYEEVKKNQDMSSSERIKTKATTETVTSLNNIAEDKATTHTVLSSPSAPDSNKVQDLREEIITLLKQALNIQEDVKGPSQTDTAPDTNKQISDQKELHIDVSKAQNVFDLFKTTIKSEGLSEREKESVILKFGRD